MTHRFLDQRVSVFKSQNEEGMRKERVQKEMGSGKKAREVSSNGNILDVEM